MCWRSGTAEAAKGELRTQYDRHKQMLGNSSILLEGAMEAATLDAAMFQTTAVLHCSRLLPEAALFTTTAVLVQLFTTTAVLHLFTTTAVLHFFTTTAVLVARYYD